MRRLAGDAQQWYNSIIMRGGTNESAWPERNNVGTTTLHILYFDRYCKPSGQVRSVIRSFGYGTVVASHDNTSIIMKISTEVQAFS